MQKQAYSYARFSTPRQTYGTSLERQLKIAREWYVQEIAPLGIPQAEIACDEGLSAWKGEHLEQGSLGHFLAEIKSGSVAPGSILIAENLDRISRQGPKIARKLLEQIVDNGVANIRTYSCRVKEMPLKDVSISRSSDLRNSSPEPGDVAPERLRLRRSTIAVPCRATPVATSTGWLTAKSSAQNGPEYRGSLMGWTPGPTCRHLRIRIRL
jgi:hypothetical protein